MFKHYFISVVASSMVIASLLGGAESQNPNQTAEVSPVLQNQFKAFQVGIDLADFQLPQGIQSYAWASYKGKWLLLCGRINGLHGFNPGNNNFPPNLQNTFVYVIDPASGHVATRSLTDPSSGLNQNQIDSLSVTAPQSYQSDATLYITGGYGVITATGKFSTKDTLTAINIPGLMHWVVSPDAHENAAQYIRQISNPIFQVTGGYMDRVDDEPFLLMLGQNFQGFYSDNSNGIYSDVVRRFKLVDNGTTLGVKILPCHPLLQNQNYRRRDLNVVPVVLDHHGKNKKEFIALSGVFTISSGIWTVPITISKNGKTTMPNPLEAETFKQAMNNYNSAYLSLFSKKTKDTYIVLFGGITYGFFNNGTLQFDLEFPFTNQVTTINVNKKGEYTQYLMNNTYPVILSEFSNPGNQLLFGAGARLILAEGTPHYNNGVVKLDELPLGTTLIGYIIGGIQSTLPNTNTITDSAASPYVFKVTIKKQ